MFGKPTGEQSKEATITEIGAHNKTVTQNVPVKTTEAENFRWGYNNL